MRGTGGGRPRARSLYKGIRVTLTQSQEGDVCLVSVSVKQPEQSWQDWSLLFPAIRVQSREVDGYEDILRLIADTLGGLLEAERINR